MPVVFAEEWDTPGYPNQHRTAATRTLFCVVPCILYSRSRSLLGLISWSCKSHDRKELPKHESVIAQHCSSSMNGNSIPWTSYGRVHQGGRV